MTSVLPTPALRGAHGPPPGPPARAVRGSRVAWAFLAAGAAAVLCSSLGPVWLQGPIFVVTVLAGPTALILGVRRYLEPGHRRPWWALLAVQAAFVSAMVVRALLPGASDVPPRPIALVPDMLVVPGYLLMAYCFADMLRRRRAADDDPARADAFLVALGAAFAMWTFLLAPQVAAANLSPLLLVNAFFPVFDVVLLVLVAQLLLAGGSRQPALWMLLACAGTLFAADLLYALRDTAYVGNPQQIIDVLFIVCYLLPGAAALHPSMRALTEPQHVIVRDLGVLRTALLAVVLVAPTVIVTVAPAATTGTRLVQAGLSVLVILAVLARVVRNNDSRARAEQSTRWRATHDPLTELPNRELLAETITAWGARATDEGNEISLLFIDLDRFKMVNDHWGHQVGDELLCLAAGRLSAMVRSEDLVCRIGGDEFVVALASRSHSALAESLADRLICEFGEPFDLSVGSVVVTPSIGIARSAGATEALELIRDADTAMYKAKGSGRNAYVLFDTSLREQVRNRMTVEQALRGALGRGELSVNYQPIIDLATDELDGFEALMRWNHPELGAVSPLDFIPVAEETGLIVASGAWLLGEAIEQLVVWRDQRPVHARPLHISINVSVRQLRNRQLVDVVQEVLTRTGLAPESLWLEITESALMEDIKSTVATLQELRELGVVLCIDDFGTGYSSLSYLNQLPVGILKIDRSFIAGVGEQGATSHIVRAVLAMAQSMGLQVVAEGVESAEQRDWLRRHGCELAQGWLYGAPRPPDALGDWIRRPRGAPQIGASGAPSVPASVPASGDGGIHGSGAPRLR